MSGSYAKRRIIMVIKTGPHGETEVIQREGVTHLSVAHTIPTRCHQVIHTNFINTSIKL